jgi:nicotinate-nucleotide pyrophosphorylase (carboxylating)
MIIHFHTAAFDLLINLRTIRVLSTLFELTSATALGYFLAMDKISRQTIKLAHIEDVGTGDITTMATVPARQIGKAVVIAKNNGVLSGTEAFAYAYRLTSPKVKVRFVLKDGQRFKRGDKIVRISGPSRALITGERLALNLLCHLSGIATLTSIFVQKTKKTKAAILDTRKTTPGIRGLEKAAVRHGGGKNHRMGLYDMILIKDNHIEAAGGISAALTKLRLAKTKVEIEVAGIHQLFEALKFNPDIIMLDNFSLERIRKAVKIIKRAKPRIKIEVSGGVNLDTVGPIANTGVDYISVGALTHSAKAIDFSMRYVK